MYTWFKKPWCYIVPIFGMPISFFLLQLFLQALPWVYYWGISEPFDWQIARVIFMLTFTFAVVVNTVLYFVEGNDK